MQSDGSGPDRAERRFVGLNACLGPVAGEECAMDAQWLAGRVLHQRNQRGQSAAFGMGRVNAELERRRRGEFWQPATSQIAIGQSAFGPF